MAIVVTGPNNYIRIKANKILPEGERGVEESSEWDGWIRREGGRLKTRLDQNNG